MEWPRFAMYESKPNLLDWFAAGLPLVSAYGLEKRGYGLTITMLSNHRGEVLPSPMPLGSN